MAFTKAFTYAFRDPRWLYKLGALVILGCIPGLNILAWVGYQQSIAHNIAAGQAEPLPSWDEWADILVRGLIVVSASGAYWLPAAIMLVFGVIPALRVLWLLALLWAVSVSALLSFSHVGFARSDRPAAYEPGNWLKRLRQHSAAPIQYIIGFLFQGVVIIIAALLTPPALFTLIGPMLLWTAVSVINGYILGEIAKAGKTAAIERK